MVHIVALLFFVSLLPGQLIRILVVKGITVYPHDITLVLLLVVWFFSQKKNWKSIWKLPLVKPLLLFIAICTASLFFGLGRYSGLELLSGAGYLVRFVLYTSLYVISATSLSPAFWIGGLYSTGAALCLFGIVQFFLYPDLRNLMYLGWDPHYYRLFSTLLDPNFMGIIAVLTFILGFSVFSRQKKVAPIPFLLQVLVFLSVCLTFSRSAIAGGLGAGFLFIFLKRRWKLLILGILVCLILWFVPKPGGGSSELFRQESALARLGNWNFTKDIILKAPFSGYGFNMLRSIETPGWAESENELSHATSGVDSSLLFVMATTGIMGLAGFLFLLYSMGRSGVRALKKQKTSRFGLVYLLSLVAVCIDSLFINSFFYPWVLVWMFIVSGAGEKSD